MSSGKFTGKDCRRDPTEQTGDYNDAHEHHRLKAATIQIRSLLVRQDHWLDRTILHLANSAPESIGAILESLSLQEKLDFLRRILEVRGDQINQHQVALCLENASDAVASAEGFLWRHCSEPGCVYPSGFEGLADALDYSTSLLAKAVCCEFPNLENFTKS